MTLVIIVVLIILYCLYQGGKADLAKKNKADSNMILGYLLSKWEDE